MLPIARALAVAACCVVVCNPAVAAKKAKPKPTPKPQEATGTVDANGIIHGCGAGELFTNPDEVPRTAPGLVATTLEVGTADVKVPEFVQKANNPNQKTPWACHTPTYHLRLYRDPVNQQFQFPGPTLRVRRASGTIPGDEIKVTLTNNLKAGTPETCIWAESQCVNNKCSQIPSAKQPMCCVATVKPTLPECFHGLNDTNLHFHGLHVSPQPPQDWVLLTLMPTGSTPPPNSPDVLAGTFVYDVNPLTASQPEGTYWYHPHKHGSTAAQVGGGMAGALIVEGPFDDWLKGYYGGKIADQVMVVQQIHNFNFNSPRALDVFQQLATALPLVNGKLQPKVVMNPGEVQRWRLIGATVEADAQLEIDFNGLAAGGNGIQVRQIGMDGVQFTNNNYYCQPILNTAQIAATPGFCDGTVSNPLFQLSPGNRGDFLVQAPAAAAGQTLTIPYRVFGAIQKQGRPAKKSGQRRQLRTHNHARELMETVPNPVLLNVYVCNPATDTNCTNMSMQFPPASQFPAGPPLTNITTTGSQTVQFQVNPGGTDQPPPGPNSQFAIFVAGKNNNQPMQFDDTCAAFTEPLNPNGGEQWTISQNLNQGSVPFHVFHIHVNPFQLVSTYSNNQAVSYNTCPSQTSNPLACISPVWMDSLTLPNNNATPGNNKTASLPSIQPAGAAVINQRFTDYTGAFVLHCHFLGHEDRGMMLTVQTVCPQNGQYSSTSATLPECSATSTYTPPLPPCGSAAARQKKAASAHQH